MHETERNPNDTKRDDKGRFLVGTAPGPGRPPACSDSIYMTVARQRFQPEQIASVLDAVYREALNGSIKAASLLLKYFLPQPNARIQIEARMFEPPSRAEDEFRVAGATPAEIDRQMMNRLRQLVVEQEQYEKDIEARYATNSEETE